MSSRGVLYDVFAAQAEALAGSIPDDLPEHRFSLSYRRKERAVLKAYERSRKNRTVFAYSPPKARIKPKYLLIAIIFACIVALTGSFLVWYHISGFTFKREQTNSTVYYDTTAEQKTVIEEYYCIPESAGYSLIERGDTPISVISKYDKGDKSFTLLQNIAEYESHIDTEGEKIEPIKINGNDGYTVVFDKETLVSWVMDGYVFVIAGNVDKQEAIKLAESVIVEETP